jgi:hypothetical protein
MQNDKLKVPIACNPQAMSAEAWAAHRGTARELFSRLREESRELPDGYAFRFPADALPRVAAFVDGERRCCPFLTFRIEIPSAEASITLYVAGSVDAKAVIGTAMLSQDADGASDWLVGVLPG